MATKKTTAKKTVTKKVSVKPTAKKPVAKKAPVKKATPKKPVAKKAKTNNGKVQNNANVSTKLTSNKLVIKQKANIDVDMKPDFVLSDKTGEVKLDHVRVVSLAERLHPKEKNPIVKIRNLEVKFGNGATVLKAVNDLNLNIFEGEVLGLVGESGSGKSTVGNAILGLVDHSKGEITIDGYVVPNKTKNITTKKRKELVPKAQMIFQDPSNSLNPYKNIYKIVSEGLNGLDVRSIFIKTFDGITIGTLVKLVGKNEQTPVLKGLSLDWIHKAIDEKRIEEIRAKVYVDVISETKDLKLEWAKNVNAYLEARLFERDKYFSEETKVKDIKKRMVIDLLKSVGLSERVLTRYPLEFSGGQQQRIGISRAVIMKPKILVADEPISALDVSIQAQVVNIFNDLKEKLGLTILFIAHDLRMVEYISDRIAILYKGVLVEVGPAAEVSANPIHPYSKMLLDAVPSIDGKQGSLIGYIYDPAMHDYSQKEPDWIQVGKDRYVRGNLNEVQRWLKKDWSNPKTKKEAK